MQTYPHTHTRTGIHIELTAKWTPDRKKGLIPIMKREDPARRQMTLHSSSLLGRRNEEKAKDRERKLCSSYIIGDFKSIGIPVSTPPWMRARVCRHRQNWNKRVFTRWWQSVVFMHFVYIELMSWHGAAHTESPDTKDRLVKHTEFMTAVILTAVSMKAAGPGPMMECSVM